MKSLSFRRFSVRIQALLFSFSADISTRYFGSGADIDGHAADDHGHMGEGSGNHEDMEYLVKSQAQVGFSEGVYDSASRIEEATCQEENEYRRRNYFQTCHEGQYAQGSHDNIYNALTFRGTFRKR